MTQKHSIGFRDLNPVTPHFSLCFYCALVGFSPRNFFKLNAFAHATTQFFDLAQSYRNFGFVFTKRTPRSITINFNGQDEVYELLCILDFNNVRKRMSVILKREGKIRLYCKGADTVIKQRLKPGQERIVEETQDHLDVRYLS